MFAAVQKVLRSPRVCAPLALAALLLGASSASASISLDATSTQVGTPGATTLNWTHTLGSGGNRMVVCTVAFGYNDTAISSPIAPSMTFNGVAMTAAVQAPTHAESSTAKIFSQIFYITDTALGVPAAGTYPGRAFDSGRGHRRRRRGLHLGLRRVAGRAGSDRHLVLGLVDSLAFRDPHHHHGQRLGDRRIRGRLRLVHHRLAQHRPELALLRPERNRQQDHRRLERRRLRRQQL